MSASSPPSATIDAWVRDRLAGRLPEIVFDEVIGAGAGGTVLAGEDVGTGRAVAAKVVVGTADGVSGARRRLRAEAEVVCSCRHPNVVRGLAHHEEEDLAVLVLERRPGVSLWRRQQDRALHLHEVLSVIEAVAAGLDHVHGKGWLHGDVQPANVIVDADGAHCLVDFGLAWRWPFTVPRRVPGTAWFQAPEAVLAGGRLEPATDVYALAVTTYLLLAGRLPFVETDCEATVLRMQVEVPPLPLRVVAPRVSAPVARVVMAGLDKDVDRRIGSAGAFARALVDAADSSHPSTWGGSP